MTLPDYDAAILGAGPAGSTLALLLAYSAPQPGRIALLRSTRASPYQATDPRTIALNHGSLQLLTALAARPARAADIHTIHVSQRGRLGRTLIRRDDFGVPVLGQVARYDAIQTALDAALATSGVTLLDGPGTLVGQDERGVTVAHGGQRRRAAIAVNADGAPRADLAGDYGQHALLTTVAASQPRPGWAWERFTRAGPLALLPHPDGTDRYALVWCSAPEHAAALAASDDAAFAVALNVAFGGRLGTLRSVGARVVAPLALRLRAQVVTGRCVVIGNAAQTLHPVAGQGLNLGLRDAARLAQALTPWFTALRTYPTSHPTADPTPYLAAYAQARRADRGVTAALTDALPRVFATGCPAVEHASGLALLALDSCSALRAPLARQLLQGLRG